MLTRNECSRRSSPVCSRGCGVTSHGFMPETSVIRLECTSWAPLVRTDQSFRGSTAVSCTCDFQSTSGLRSRRNRPVCSSGCACVLLAAPGRSGGRARGGLGGRRREHRRSDVLLGALRARCAPAASQETLCVAWVSPASPPQPTRPHGGGLLCVGVADVSGVCRARAARSGPNAKPPRAADPVGE